MNNCVNVLDLAVKLIIFSYLLTEYAYIIYDDYWWTFILFALVGKDVINEKYCTWILVRNCFYLK